MNPVAVCSGSAIMEKTVTETAQPGIPAQRIRGEKYGIKMENLPAGGGNSGGFVSGDALLDRFYRRGGPGAWRGAAAVLWLCHRVCRQHPNELSRAPCGTKVQKGDSQKAVPPDLYGAGIPVHFSDCSVDCADDRAGADWLSADSAEGTSGRAGRCRGLDGGQLADQRASGG